jgi:hypothetical protein
VPILGTLVLGGCSGLWGDDEFNRYYQRSDKITLSAGNAKQVNAVAHMIDPWAPGVGDRQIVHDGVRMQRALERYRRNANVPDPMPDIGLEGTRFGERLAAEPPARGSGGVPGGTVGVPTTSQGQTGQGQ